MQQRRELRPLLDITDLSAHSDENYLEQLVLAVAGGNAAALTLLLEKTGPELRRMARHRLRCHDDAEELLWDVYAYVWKSAASYDAARGTVGAWLGIIVSNRCIDRLRSRRAMVSLSDDRNIAILESIRCEWLGPEEQLLQSETGISIHRALQALSPLKRHIVKLAFFNGLAHHEVANAVGLPLGTVKSHLRRSLLSLRAALHLRLRPRSGWACLRNSPPASL